MLRMPNVVEIDATAVTTSGILIPKDIDNSDVVNVPRGYDFADFDAYEFGTRSVKSDWVIKVVNDADNPVDVEAGVSTGSDEMFADWTTDGTAETAPTGDPPNNVVHISGETVAAFLGTRLTADPVPTTGTITIEFGSRRLGGA